MKHTAWLALLALLWLPPSGATAATHDHWHELRTLGFGLCASLLLQFNPYEANRDLSRADSYRADLDRLQQLAGQLPTGEALTLVEQMRGQIDELERQPASDQYRFAHWLDRVLELHAQLEQAAAQHYARQLPATPGPAAALQALSLDTSRQLLLYQVRSFRFLRVPSMTIDDDSVDELDRHILDAFSRLSAEEPDLAAELGKLQRNYSFVRNKLLDKQQSQAPSAVERYLRNTVQALDHLAANAS